MRRSRPVQPNRGGRMSDADKIVLAGKAISGLLRRLQRDGRIAYYFDPITQSFEDLTAAHCALQGIQDVSAFRETFAASLNFEAPAAA